MISFSLSQKAFHYDSAKSLNTWLIQERVLKHWFQEICQVVSPLSFLYDGWILKIYIYIYFILLFFFL